LEQAEPAPSQGGEDEGEFPELVDLVLSWLADKKTFRVQDSVCTAEAGVEAV
jgi:hypothetical protein